MQDPAPNIIIMMGVMSAGKTYVGERLARYLSYGFYECDEAHSPANVTKMRAGIPLTDADRKPWLATMANMIREWDANDASVVMTCPSHKKTYRDTLRVAPVQFVHLNPPRITLENFVASRTHKYMNPKLLDSQLAIMENPEEDENIITVINDRPVNAVISEIVQQLADRYVLTCPLPQNVSVAS